MTRSRWILVFSTSVQPILYQFAWGTDGTDSVFTQWNTNFPKPAAALADTILGTIIPPGKFLLLPWLEGKTDSSGGSSLIQVHGGKAKRRDAFELPDDPIKEAVWRAATSSLLLPKSAVSGPASSTLQSTKLLRQENTALCATTTCRNGVHSSDGTFHVEAVPVQKLSPSDQAKTHLPSERGRSKTSPNISASFTTEKTSPALEQRIFRLSRESKGEQVADAAAPLDSGATARTSSSLDDSITARLYIINFAREVGTQYGDPEMYGNCAAEFVDQFLSPAELTVQLAQLMMEVDSRDSLAAETTAYVRTLDDSLPFTRISDTVSLTRNTKEIKDEIAHLPYGLPRLSDHSHTRQWISALPQGETNESSQSAVLQKNILLNQRGTVRGLHTVLTDHDPMRSTELEVESASLQQVLSGSLGVRFNSAFATSTGRLYRPPVQLESRPMEKGEHQTRSDPKHEKLRGPYPHQNLTDEAARSIIISFAGEIGDQKGAPEEHVRLAEAFVDRYLKPTGWTQYIAEMIMEARREYESSNFTSVGGLRGMRVDAQKSQRWTN